MVCEPVAPAEAPPPRPSRWLAPPRSALPRRPGRRPLSPARGRARPPWRPRLPGSWWPEVGLLLLPTRPLFSFLRAAGVTGAQTSPPRDLRERLGGGEGGAAGAGVLRLEPQPPAAQVSAPGLAHASPPRPAARSRGCSEAASCSDSPVTHSPDQSCLARSLAPAGTAMNGADVAR